MVSRMDVSLNRLLRKESDWKAGEELPEDAIEAFHKLKEALIKRSLLFYVVPSERFILDMDVSQYTIGACLQQIQERIVVPLAYCSKTLGPSCQNFCTTKREMYACIYAM